MKLSFLIGSVALLSAAIPANADDQLLAFPGAEGYGRFATGGRGGTIYHVTNLDDSGKGSFRDAVSSPNRIVVFDVAGVINLKSTLVFAKDLTILGQTAPGEGVQIYGDRVSFSGANNIIVRYLRLRMGVGGTSGKDAAGVANGGNMIFDHLSVLWGRDECFSINWDNKGAEPHDITIQNSIIGQGLQPHSCGGLVQTNGGVTLYRNLYIENKTRNPKVKGLNQFVNNVLYNWGNGAAYNMGGDSAGESWAEISGNYFVRGPWQGATRPLIGGNDKFHYVADDNWYDSNLNGELDGTAFADDLYTASGGDRMADIAALEAKGAPKTFPEIKGLQTANEALTYVLKHGGASLPVRDEVDGYLIDELSSYGKLGTSAGISSERELPHGGTGRLYGGYKPADTDGDGIPDEWESANGLDPNDATDAAKIAANGYANIENYSFSIEAAFPYVKHPTKMHIISIDKDEIELGWDDNADDENNYILEYSTDGTNFSQMSKTAKNVTSAWAVGLEENTKYYFRVYALRADGVKSIPSPVMTAVTTEPVAPEQSTKPYPADEATPGVLEDVVLSWTNTTPNTFGDVTYTVKVGTSADALETKADGLTAPSLKLGRLEVGTKYYWRVDATNAIGTTKGEVWSFTMVPGGRIFYTDFNTSPEEWATSDWGTVIAGSNKDLKLPATFGDMTIGGSGRAVAMGNANNSADTSKDYGPYNADHAGASNRCVQFVTANSNYVLVDGLTGPADITVYSANPNGKNSMSYKIHAIYDTNGDGVINSSDEKTTLATVSMAKNKRIYKFTASVNKADNFSLRLDGSTDKINFNDIIVEGKDLPSGLDDLTVASAPVAHIEGDVLTVSMLRQGDYVTVCDLSGRCLVNCRAGADGGVSVILPRGLVIVKAPGMRALKAIVH